jgi:hypothetical protein
MAESQSVCHPSPAVELLRDDVLTRYGEAVQAIVFYGSCLRSRNALDGLVDLYVIVSSYRLAYGSRALALFNQVLPPNVFYLEVPSPDGCVRAKYNVLSLRHLQRSTSPSWFHSYFWARFAQPSGIIFARNRDVAASLRQSFAQAALTFCARVIPRLRQPFDAADLWQTGLSLSYGSELRAERPHRARELFEAFQSYYEPLTEAVLPGLPFPMQQESQGGSLRYRACISGKERVLNAAGWWLRAIQGKGLSLLRLIKAVFTFRGGVDYIVWKLERHSGTRIEVPARLRRHPLLFSWSFLWRLYRRGVFR